MGLHKFDKTMNYIQSLDDNPNISGMDASTLKAQFDKAGTDIKDYINNTLTDELDTKFATTSSDIGTLSNLDTTTKTDIVSAVNEVNGKLDDTGWQTLPLASGVTPGINGATPRYRKIGKVVYVDGSFAFTKGSTSMDLATLPEGYRPSGGIYNTTSTSGSRIGRTYITTGGGIGCDWIYNIGGTAYTGSVTWYSVSTSFIVD